jgi:hypothetical protein
LEAEPITTIGSVLLNLVPVIIGGLLATGGAFAGAFLTHRFNQKASKDKIKREKLEQLANAAYRTIHWLDEHKDVNLFKKSKEIGSSPIFEVEYLSKLYIPELRKEVAKVSVSSAEMVSFIVSCKLFVHENGSFPTDFVEKYSPLYGNLLSATQELIERATIVAGEL